MSRAEDLIARGLNKIPGYKGYRDKESRRDVDKRLRESIADALGVQVDALTRYNAELANMRDFESLASIEPAISQVRTLSDRIRHASYGYGGLFSDNDIDANALEQMRLFDAALLHEVDGLGAAVTKMTSATPPDGDARRTMLGEITRLNSLFDGRGAVVEQGRPSHDEATLQLLAIPEVIEPSPLLQVSKGDALSVLDDNYIANGTIKLRTDEGEMVLARVSTEANGATWLLGSSVPGMGSARLIESNEGESGFQTLVPATARIDTDQGSQEDIAARFAYRKLGDNQVELTLAIGDTIKRYTGSTLVDKDIEVYGVA